MNQQKDILFLCFDVEADGPCPGLNSMLSLGMAGFTTDATIVFEFESNLLPLPDAKSDPATMKWWHNPARADAWKYVNQNQKEPLVVFRDLKHKLKNLFRNYRIFPMAKPANYDWQWINYYFHRFLGENPLGFSARCISTYAWAISGKLAPSDGMEMYKWANPNFKHTHRALDDAKEAGFKLVNMWRFHTKQEPIDYNAIAKPPLPEPKEYALQEETLLIDSESFNLEN